MVDVFVSVLTFVCVYPYGWECVTVCYCTCLRLCLDIKYTRVEKNVCACVCNKIKLILLFVGIASA